MINTGQLLSSSYKNNSSEYKLGGLPANGAPQSKTRIQFLDELLHALQPQKGLKEFAFFVANNSEVQQKLKESPNNSSIIKRLVQVGKEYNYEFTEKDVKEVFGVLCSPCSMEELSSKLVAWGKGGLQQFLTDIKNELCLKKELEDKSCDRNKFVTFLKDTLKQLNKQDKYQWLTEQDIEEAAKLIPFDEKKSEPENPAKVPKIVGTIWS
jgi:hypothetical protein